MGELADVTPTELHALNRALEGRFRVSKVPILRLRFRAVSRDFVRFRAISRETARYRLFLLVSFRCTRTTTVQEYQRAHHSMFTRVLLKDGHNVPDWANSSPQRQSFVKRDLCPQDGEIYMPGAPADGPTLKCPKCGYPRYVQTGPYAGKPCASCYMFDEHLMFARWFATPGLSALFNPHHGDTNRGCIVEPDGTIVWDPDFPMKVRPVYVTGVVVGVCGCACACVWCREREREREREM